MKKITLIILVAAAAFFSFGFKGCQKKSVQVKDVWGQVFEIKNKNTSPMGANVWAQDGTVITAEDYAAIDRGLERTFAKARCKGYTKNLTHSAYTVAILKATDLDSNGNPVFRTSNRGYEGSVYDKGGYITVGGQVVSVGHVYGNIIAIPDASTDFDYMALTAEYESEHNALADNDLEEFERTKNHASGVGHPIIADCPQ